MMKSNSAITASRRPRSRARHAGADGAAAPGRPRSALRRHWSSSSPAAAGAQLGGLDASERLEASSRQRGHPPDELMTTLPLRRGRPEFRAGDTARRRGRRRVAAGGGEEPENVPGQGTPGFPPSPRRVQPGERARPAQRGGRGRAHSAPTLTPLPVCGVCCPNPRLCSSRPTPRGARTNAHA